MNTPGYHEKVFKYYPTDTRRKVFVGKVELRNEYEGTTDAPDLISSYQ